MNDSWTLLIVKMNFQINKTEDECLLDLTMASACSHVVWNKEINNKNKSDECLKWISILLN